MLFIVADRYDDPLELCACRDRFKCEAFSYTVAADGKSGFVVLLPKGQPLKVSEHSANYMRIRVLDSTGNLHGAMSCRGDGCVYWTPGALP